MLAENTIIDTKSFEENSIVFPAVFAKAVNRFKQISVNKDSIEVVSENIRKKVEPSLIEREEEIWAQWGNIIAERG